MQASTLQPWQQGHAGHWIRVALERFDTRVVALIARHSGVALGLANLAARGQLGAAHMQITRHLDPQGMRLTALARKAGISKQAMGALVVQCEAWGMLERHADASDARARVLRFTPLGLAWLDAYRAAVAQAQAEMRAAIGDEVCTVVLLGLEAYCSQ